MKTLKNVKWMPFSIEDVCEIASGRDIYDKERFDGNNPYITASALNNGIGYFVGNKNDTLESGCISVNRNGSVGYSFYHPYSALYGNDTRKLRPFNKNRYVCFFLTRMITAQKDKYGYGLKLGTERLKKQQIMLPATPDGTPDFKFMEQYMRGIEKKLLKRYARYLENKGFSRLGNSFIETGKIDNTERWKQFNIGDLFTALRPVARSENNYSEGNIPFVASGAVNNGVTKFCKPNNDEKPDKGYCITVSPVDGSCHYHEYDFLGRGGAGSSVVILYPKEMMLSRNVALFIVKCISQTTISKYCYGLMASKDRLLSDVFLLPATPDGTPDFKFMEQYMREKEQKLIHRYIEYRLKNV